MGKTFDIKAGTRTRILWIFSSSIPGTVRFTAAPSADGPLTGVVELARRRWFDMHRTNHDLHARNVFEKGMADADYRIYVTPDQDCHISFATRHMRAEIYFRILAGVFIMGLLAAATALIFAPPAPPG